MEEDPSARSGKIIVLPSEVIGRIAAGEVIERPASVAKEMVENSIDAGSSRIDVEVRGGGRLLVRVVDDGEGMTRPDALLAFERHATSKIRTDEDLWDIQSLGFRGEALPSVASVSRMRLVTRARGESAGTELLLEGGKVRKVQETGAPPGTHIEVRELFYNTPARRKFLRSVTTELGHISRQIQQQAIAHPEISFRLVHEGRCLIQAPAVPDRLQRIQQLYPKSLTDSLVVATESWEKIRVWGAFSKPPHTRGTRAHQEIFVNGRPVSSPPILHALYAGYETLLMKGQHPVVFIFLQLAGQAVDINVHPAKREVRFRDQRQIHDLVRGCVRAGLDRVAREDLHVFEEAEGSGTDPRADRIREAAAEYVRTHGTQSWSGESRKPGAGPARAAGTVPFTAPVPMERQGKFLPEQPVSVQPLGQIYQTFIVSSIQGELWIIDQHAAHERILYERYLQAIRNSRIPVQPLLIPQTLELSEAQVMVLQEWSAQLKSLGFELEMFGPRTLMIRSVPVFLQKTDLQALAADIVEDWIHLGKIPSPQERQKTMVATLACHGAVKANEALTFAKMEALLRDMLEYSEVATCPHGRPIRIKFSRKEMESMFRR